MLPRMLMVDDDRERAKVLASLLGEDFECSIAHDLEQAYGIVGAGPWSVALVDYDLPPSGSGLEFLQTLRDLTPRTLRVLYSVHYSGALARDAARIVPTDAVLDARPADFMNDLRATVRRLLDATAASEPTHATLGHGEDVSWFATAPAMREFMARLRAAAEQDVAVFLFGEPSTGKHLAARTLRRWREEWRQREGLAPFAHAQAGPAGVPAGMAAAHGGPRPGPGGANHGAHLPMPILLRMPTLSERRQDIPALANWALAEHARSRRENPKRLGPGVDEELARREWHGNMLELRAVLVRAHQRAGTRSTVNLPDLPHDNDPGGHPSQHRKDEGQRDALLRQLQAAGSIRRAAELEGIARPNYIRLMKRLGIIRADTHPYGEDEA